MEIKHEIIAKMARLIRENPGITVTEMAKRLGFAQERSIYYWLRKGRYRGIKEFRHAVLSGLRSEAELQETPVESPAGTRPTVDPAVPLAWVPLRRQNEPGLPPLPAQTAASAVPTRHRVGPRTFALELESAEYTPFLEPGDVLLIDPDELWSDGDLVVAWDHDRRHFVRVAYGRDPVLLIHPRSPKAWHRLRSRAGQTQVVGKVVQLIRQF